MAPPATARRRPRKAQPELLLTDKQPPDMGGILLINVAALYADVLGEHIFPGIRTNASDDTDNTGIEIVVFGCRRSDHGMVGRTIAMPALSIRQGRSPTSSAGVVRLAAAEVVWQVSGYEDNA
jgi:hypothetical protein